MKVGSVTKIMRHPVKSFTGESVESVEVMSYGLYGDRSHAFIDKKSGKYVTITQYPNMVTYRARFIGEEKADVFPRIEISTNDGSTYDWNDDDLLKRISQESNRQIDRVTYQPDFVPFPAIEEDNLLLISTTSLRELENTYGEEVDERRFRGNIIYEIENKELTEDNLIGKVLCIGNDVKIRVNKYCERCMIITVNPETGTKDPKLLKQIVKERSNHFGLYGSVLQTGKIKNGDSIQIKDE
ncbi:MAG TPA: MOSC N-terminal beta barrel domain-containing protein [Niallia sp.]|nr:MOSC N-terminal beta barrel domain-containing protein [Niallia sp.]